MTTRTEEVERADRAVKDAEIRLRTLQIQIETLDREIAQLSWTESTLQDNLNCLKREKVIALATEYKKSKEELARIRNRLKLVNNDKLKIKRSYEETEKAMKKAIEHRDDLMWRLENNVLYGDFGKSDGQA